MAKDWSKLYKQYFGKWIALKDDELTVVGSGKTAKSALHQAKLNGVANPILYRVPTKLMPYIGEAAI